jgi:starvation-inducible DNA-binding protein
MSPKTAIPPALLYPTRIDLPETSRQRAIVQLNQTLAATLDLVYQMKQAHWNVKSPTFYAYHELFDTLAEAFDPFVDPLAERITALGGYAQGTVRMAAQASPLPEMDLVPEPRQDVAPLYMKALAERLATYAQHLRQGIALMDTLDDPGSADLLTEISQEADKRLWFVESHLV